MERIRAAWVSSNLTQDELIERAKLQITQGALSRRLSGKTRMPTDDAEALLRVLRRWLPDGDSIAARRCAAALRDADRDGAARPD